MASGADKNPADRLNPELSSSSSSFSHPALSVQSVEASAGSAKIAGLYPGLQYESIKAENKEAAPDDQCA